jgi:flagellar hook-length control protein FliK
MMQTSPNPAIISATPIKHAAAKPATEASKDATEDFAMLVDAPDQVEADPRSTTRRNPEGFELRKAEVSVDVSGGPAAPYKIIYFSRLDKIALESEATDSSPTASDSRPTKADPIYPLWIMLDVNAKPSLPTSIRQQTVPLQAAFHSKAIAAGSPLKDQAQSPPIVGPALAPIFGDRETKQPGKFSPLTDLSTGQAAARRAEPVANRFNKTIESAELNRSTASVSALPGADQLSSTVQLQIVPTTTDYSAGQDQNSSRQDKPETIDKSAAAPSHGRSSENSIETALVNVAEPSTLPPRPIFHQVARALAETAAAAPSSAAPEMSISTLRVRQITIELKPEGLGRIVATLTSIAGQLQVRLQPDSEPVAQQLQSDMGNLGQALAAAGVAISDISIAPAVNTGPSTINASAQDAATGSGARGEEARPQGRGDNRGEFTRHRRDTSPDGTPADIASRSDHFYVV